MLQKILCAFLLLAGVSRAADIYVANGGSHTSPYETWAKAATSLYAAVSYASIYDTLILTNETFTLTGAVTLATTLTFTGVNASSYSVIDAQQLGRCFVIGCSTAKFYNIKFTGGYTGVGEATTGAYSAARGCGAAIWSNTNNFFAQNCSFVSNNGDLRGGAIYGCLSSDTNNSLLTFSDNSALDYGGAYYGFTNRGSGRSLILKNCTFSNNLLTKATAASGGAVYLPATMLANFSGILFVTNKCISAGACSIQGTGTSIFENCTFLNNIANLGGTEASAISCLGTITANSCQFLQNKGLAMAGGGQATVIYAIQLNMWNSLVQGSVASQGASSK